MLYFIRKYPLSLLVIAAILFLSLFNPPKTKLDPITGIDKVVQANGKTGSLVSAAESVNYIELLV